MAKRIVLVTGGMGGLGESICTGMADQGYTVVATHSPSNKSADAWIAAMRDKGYEFHAVPCDVADYDSCAAAVKRVEESVGPVDVLVNNAGILMFKGLMQTTLDDYRRVLEVNLVGEFLGIKAVAPGMIARGRGAIVNISSVDGMKGANGLAAYASSKWGVRGLTKVAAMELGHLGIRVNSVHPGGVDTAMTNYEGLARETVNERFRNIPLQRVGTPEEVARATLFLASDESSYMAGAEIVVDGGMITGQYYPLFPGAPGVDPGI